MTWATNAFRFGHEFSPSSMYAVRMLKVISPRGNWAETRPLDAQIRAAANDPTAPDEQTVAW